MTDATMAVGDGQPDGRSARTDRPVLSVRDLRTVFETEDGIARAVDGVSFEVWPRETVALVGESGCGKSAAALSILRLIDPPGRIEAGSAVVLEGRDLLTLDISQLRALRGNRVAMVFQEPMSALNPAFRIGDQIAEVVRVHETVSRDEAWSRAVAMLDAVGIADAAERARWFPHQLSGGTRQRVLMAMALVLRPALLIADEPTTALDVTIQQQILELLLDLKEELGMAIVIITHNMGVVAEMADRVIVMYAGRIVERAPVGELFERPAHPYTRGLLESIPSLADERDRLKTIPGTLPNPAALPPGCRFEPRCHWRIGACSAAVPPLERLREGHESACIRQRELAAP